ncbi:MAG: phage integrase SAM-like domain-containing protein [Dysgonomonas sp.]
MATLNYRTKGTKKDTATIYARFKHSREHDYEISMGFEVDKKRWSKPKQQVNLSTDTVSYCDQINTNLREFKNYITTQFNIAQTEGVDVSRKWLELQRDEYFNRKSNNSEADKSRYLTDFAEWYIEFARTSLNPKTGKPRKKRTIQDYECTLKRLKHFEQITDHKYRLTEIDKDFHSEYVNYCVEHHKLKENTIGGSVDLIKLFLRNAENEGYKVSNDYKKGFLVSPTNETYDIALSTKDIEKIQHYDFSHSERLDNARDWFVIGIWTGLRVSDLLKLTPKEMSDGFFELKTRKTDTYVVIPIHHEVKKILAKRKGFPRRISDQKFNEYIKEVGKEVGLTDIIEGAKMVKVDVIGYDNKPAKDSRKILGQYPKYELIASHTCRRTFATYHYGKLDTLTIMNITGHTTEKQFLEYVKITPRQHAQRLKEMWNKMNHNNKL